MYGIADWSVRVSGTRVGNRRRAGCGMRDDALTFVDHTKSDISYPCHPSQHRAGIDGITFLVRRGGSGQLFATLCVLVVGRPWPQLFSNVQLSHCYCVWVSGTYVLKYGKSFPAMISKNGTHPAQVPMELAFAGMAVWLCGRYHARKPP